VLVWRSNRARELTTREEYVEALEAWFPGFKKESRGSYYSQVLSSAADLLSTVRREAKSISEAISIVAAGLNDLNAPSKGRLRQRARHNPPVDDAQLTHRLTMGSESARSSSLTIEALAQRIPRDLLRRSGKVFYSGRAAFSVHPALYVLGANPGGDPPNYEAETVESHTAAVLHSHPDDWSAYRDESWEGAAPGTYGMAPRMLHLFAGLGLAPGQVPASNLVFARSCREGHMKNEMKGLADLCWPFHATVIEQLRPPLILCLGQTAGRYVRRRLGANALVGELVETNNRRWRSQTFVDGSGLKVVVATHPSIVDWTAASSDPTPLVRDALL